MWESTGLSQIHITKLKFVDPYIYACGGPEGLYRKNVRTTSGWEYLGMADSSLHSWDRGVRDVDIVDGDILAAFVGDYSVPAKNGLWRSRDNGLTFTVSDSGIADENVPYGYVSSVSRCKGSRVSGVAIHGGLYTTTDGGSSWLPLNNEFYPRIMRPPGPLENVVYHDQKVGEVWAYGYNPIWDSFLLRSTDNGVSWQDFFPILHDTLRGAIPTDIAFDSQDAGVIYLGVVPSLLKSTDNGATWLFPLTREGPYFSLIATHPSISNHLFLSDGTRIYSSSDGGSSVTRIRQNLNLGVTALCVSAIDGTLFVGTASGVYRYRGH